MNIVITGGGTGGHLSIAKALALECKKRGFNVFYIGSTIGQDKLWFEKNDIFKESYFLESTGVVNKKGLKIFKALYLQFRATLKSIKILKNNNIQATISVGGFSAGGASMASILLRIPFFIHEQNSVLGTLNKLLSPFAKIIFGSFDIKLKNFVKTSYPINDEFFNTARIRLEKNSILFLGGSQGARDLNSFALNIAKELINRNIKIIHQCGKTDFNRVKLEYEKLELTLIQTGEYAYFGDSVDSSKIILFSFDNNIAKKMQNADFCVSRAGASSIWELCANNLPCCFVPYPFAAKNHQYFNALFLKKLGLSEIFLQQKLNKDDFLRYLDDIDLSSVSKGLKKLISPNGSKEIIDKILVFIK